MHLHTFESKVQNYMRQRCREHLVLKERLLGRPITFDYRYEHTRTTVAIAERLAEELGVDPALARIAAWLHDIAKCWDPQLSQVANCAREEDHGRAGGEEAAKYLRSLGFPRDLTQQVETAIARHVGFIKDYILDEPLDALLWDADKLSKISGAGIVHYLGARMTMGNEMIDLRDFFTQVDGDLHLGIRNSLNTEIARRWADGELEGSTRMIKYLLAGMEGISPGDLTFPPWQA